MAVPKLFISSTKDDLTEYRDAAGRAARELGFDVRMMEDFGPHGELPADLCREVSEWCDFLVGIYAHRGGFAPGGFSGRTMTRLEYQWAKAAGAETLAFIVHPDHPWPPRFIDTGTKKKKLDQFKAELKTNHVIDTFTTPEDLRVKLFKYLSPRRHQADLAAAEVEAMRPPRISKPYVPHTYSLLQTKGLIGRRAEVEKLDQWAGAAEERVQCLLAIGGMGKSALAWHWFQSKLETTEFRGKVWWSFYELDAGFDTFLTSVVAYLEGKGASSVSRLSIAERERRLLEALASGEHLIVLDGLERLLIAYSGMDYAHLDDDELDRITANTPTESAASRGDDAAAQMNARRLRRATDPHVDSFLRKLSTLKSSRVLITSRLIPSSLQTTALRPLPGMMQTELEGLTSADAIALWRSAEVTGSDDDLTALFSTFGNYPLLVRALAGEVANFRGGPGDFDAWRADNPGFNPFSLPLVQVKTHVLAYALANLTPNTRSVLNAVAAFRSPVSYATLSDIVRNQGGDKKQLTADLRELEDRGLLGWDRGQNTYDLHPVVRNVVWNTLGEKNRTGVLEGVRAHFEEEVIGEVERQDTNTTKKVAVELFNVLVGLSRHKDALTLYRDRFSRDGVSISRSDARTEISMLEVLPTEVVFAPSEFEGEERWNDGGPSYRLPILYTAANEFEKAVDTYCALIERWPRSSMYPLMAGAAAVKVLVRMGLFKEVFRIADSMEDALFEALGPNAGWNPLRTNVAMAKFLTGSHTGGGFFPELADRKRRNDLDSFIKLAVNNACMVLNTSLIYPVHVGGGDLAEAYDDVTLQRNARALERLTKIIAQARERGSLETEIRASILCAKVLSELGRDDKAKETLSDALDLAAVGPSRLLQVDCLNDLATVERRSGDPDAALNLAWRALAHARRDGVFEYKIGAMAATKTLAALGVQAPAWASTPSNEFAPIARRLLDTLEARYDHIVSEKDS